jgi:hypothetical protein
MISRFFTSALCFNLTVSKFFAQAMAGNPPGRFWVDGKMVRPKVRLNDEVPVAFHLGDGVAYLHFPFFC